MSGRRATAGSEQDSRQEFTSFGLLGIAEHLLRGSFLPHPALVQEGDPIRDLAGEPHLMGGHDNGETA